MVPEDSMKRKEKRIFEELNNVTKFRMYYDDHKGNPFNETKVVG